MDTLDDEQCHKCKTNPERKCRHCGCQYCGGKESPETQLFCEECQYTTHMTCLDPPLTQIPEGDFYCPECNLSENEIVFLRSQMGKRGESTGGRRKTWTLGWGDFEALVSETLFLDVRGNVEANEENLDCFLAVAHEIKTQRPLTHKDAFHSTDTGKPVEKLSTPEPKPLASQPFITSFFQRKPPPVKREDSDSQDPTWKVEAGLNDTGDLNVSDASSEEGTMEEFVKKENRGANKQKCIRVGGQYYCGECGKVFKSASSVYAHFTKKHSSLDSNRNTAKELNRSLPDLEEASAKPDIIKPSSKFEDDNKARDEDENDWRGDQDLRNLLDDIF